jgi:hypothetical protein
VGYKTPVIDSTNSEVMNREQTKCYSQKCKQLKNKKAVTVLANPDTQCRIGLTKQKSRGKCDRDKDQCRILGTESIINDRNWLRLVKIENLIKGYGLTNVASFYQVESRFTHPTPTGVQMFFKTEGDAFHVSQSPMHEEIVPCQLYCLWIFHIAMLAFNEVLTDKPWTTALEEIAKEYGFATTLPQWQQGSGVCLDRPDLGWLIMLACLGNR